ncbi:hypothetical protein [Parafrankia sp. FMc2]|uniref:hypothetical protein n=1 Tax=Parafrankia sp. FMc2 TaxID=3233196 RepID=UPI0034D5126C
MRLRDRFRSSGDLAADFWATDLENQTANEASWASGLPPALTRSGWQAANSDRRLGQLHDGLRRRAGHLADVPLEHLADRPETDGAATAAAALRVLESDAHLADSESLQPGVELPEIEPLLGQWGR